MYVVLGRRGIGYWEEFEVFDTIEQAIQKRIELQHTMKEWEFVVRWKW